MWRVEYVDLSIGQSSHNLDGVRYYLSAFQRPWIKKCRNSLFANLVNLTMPYDAHNTDTRVALNTSLNFKRVPLQYYECAAISSALS